MPEKLFILGLGGTPRSSSTTERALALCLRAAKNAGAETMLFTGPDLLLPMYDPSEKKRTEAAERLISAFRRAHGIVIGSPAYHGSISGLVKNALDYTEDLRLDTRAYFDGLAIGCIACAGGWQAAGQTLAAIRSIAHALRGWPTPLGVMLNSSTQLFDESGECLDLSAKMQLETIGNQVVLFARNQMLGSESQVRTPPPSRLAETQLS